MGKNSSKIFDINGEATGKTRIPQIFKTPVRPDVIKRAVIALQSHRFQPQGRDPNAGKRTTAESRGVGLGISRIPRVKQGRRAAFAPSTVGGRRTHPPKSEKKIEKKIPK
ncbi:MAG: 50S ribosomal protein L4, partial [Candidatus Bathyarchaeota archaeon]